MHNVLRTASSDQPLELSSQLGVAHLGVGSCEVWRFSVLALKAKRAMRCAPRPHSSGAAVDFLTAQLHVPAVVSQPARRAARLGRSGEPGLARDDDDCALLPLACKTLVYWLVFISRVISSKTLALGWPRSDDCRLARPRAPPFCRLKVTAKNGGQGHLDSQQRVRSRLVVRRTEFINHKPVLFSYFHTHTADWVLLWKSFGGF